MTRNYSCLGVISLSILSTMASGESHGDYLLNAGFEQTTQGVGQVRQIPNAVDWTTSGDNVPSGRGGLGKASLTVANLDKLGFSSGADQQSGSHSSNAEPWQACVENPNEVTAVHADAGHDATGWAHQTFAFKVDPADDVLAFISVGDPAEVSPPVLLDGASIASLSESSAPALLILGYFSFGSFGLGIAYLLHRIRTANASPLGRRSGTSSRPRHFQPVPSRTRASLPRLAG